MQFFVDTADLNEIRELADLGMVDGVTTNPSIIAKSGQDFKKVIKEICLIVKGSVSAEVIATKYDQMIEEGTTLSKIAENVTVKLPMTWDGLKACKYFSEREIMTNVTLCFSANQALLAAKAGATYVSPFIGRLDDIGLQGMELIKDIRDIYSNYMFETQILAASIRHPEHILEAAKIGADVATMPPKTLRQLINHPLTDIGIDMFLKDWANANQKI
ncbi:MAG: fructose-6-phosphate aldolase [Sphingobacteriia bacterium]|nr:fructose-6-phosphate aldolase [Sphingobacteriia bacterium]